MDDSTKLRIMTPFRDLLVYDAPGPMFQDELRDRGYIRAKDGIYVPACDLEQYEAGKRPIREVKYMSYKPLEEN